MLESPGPGGDLGGGGGGGRCSGIIRLQTLLTWAVREGRDDWHR